MTKQKQFNIQLNEPNKDVAEHPVRNLLVFQVKLAIDALRDILLSPVAILATLADLIGGKRGRSSYFERLMKFGRVSEAHINLFGQHKGSSRTVDNVLKQVEDILVKEYKEGDISAKTKKTIETKLKAKFKSTPESN
ncbi:hypothetical protein [Aliikangiella sp. IMCC44359]|uniref:hypothetical protein n=1 Tax=Aliikangiella sp. IMCC44359 TaxID=3459125 RepID=UPI00403B1FDE